VARPVTPPPITATSIVASELDMTIFSGTRSGRQRAFSARDGLVAGLADDP
jgi:hypothetical protein